MTPEEWRRESAVALVMAWMTEREATQIHEDQVRRIAEEKGQNGANLIGHMIRNCFLHRVPETFMLELAASFGALDLRRFQADVHQVELEFEGGVMTAKLICPTSGCSDHEGHCDLRDWFDNVCVEEMLEGNIRMPVAVDWPAPDEGPELKIVQPGYVVAKEGEGET